ncbi:MAG: polyprenyl synthetase family protein [Ruminococcaceae bacterium]|nr:polyprenyl synthetase family protein [Oscillospiraceae bacterium]
MAALKQTLSEHAERVEEALKQYGREADEELQVLFDSQAYSLLGGGKRIRPFLVNEFCRVLGGEERVSMPFACALEMIHTYSLIHDDLPCMDDDDLRRGKPTNHKEFGYATALLAGDALLTKAFLTAVQNPYADDRMRAEAVRLIAEAAGECGMIGGQIIDLKGETEVLSLETLERLHRMKTGALIECAARLGCLAAGFFPDSEPSHQAAAYAKGIGLAFQVVDDLLDVCGDSETLGKPIGADISHNKTTFLTYFDQEGAKQYARERTAEALTAISAWEGSGILSDLAVYLTERTN